MKEIETYRGVVYPWHCDFNDHMNVQHYIGKFDEATWHFLASIGVTPAYLKKEERAMVAAEQHIKYFQELYAGNLIYVKTSLLEFKPKTVIFLHQMMNAETNSVAAEGRMVGVQIDKKTRKAVPFTEEVNRLVNELQVQ
jgi:acyl-CoA thioester hydrolase